MNPVSPVLPSQPDLVGPVYAKEQPQYRPLPSIRGRAPEWKVTTRWHMGFLDRLRVLITGDVWLQITPYGTDDGPNRLQPVRIVAEEPSVEDCE